MNPAPFIGRDSYTIITKLSTKCLSNVYLISKNVPMYKFEHLPVSRRETLGNSVNVVNVLIFATDRLRSLQRN